MTVYYKFDNESTSKKASLVEAQNPNFKDPYYISKRGIVLSIIIPLGLLISVLLLHHIYAKMFHFEHRQYDNIIIDDSKVLTLDQAMDFEIWAQKFEKYYATIEEHNKRKSVFEEHVRTHHTISRILSFLFVIVFREKNRIFNKNNSYR